MQNVVISFIFHAVSLGINISHSSVATHLRSAGIFNGHRYCKFSSEIILKIGHNI